MKLKPTNRTSYQEVCKLYQATRPDYQLKTVNDLKVIHNIDLTTTPGIEDLTEEQKELYFAYVIHFMNGMGMNTKIKMFPLSVHFVREYIYCGPKEWDPDEGRELRCQIGREWIILKANGRTKKFKKYMDEDKTEADIDQVATVEKEYLRVDWKFGTSREWYHVMSPTSWY